MPASFITDDLDVILGSSDFGEPSGSVVWQGTTVTVAIFDQEDVQAELGEGTGQIVNSLKITGKSSDFDGIADGDSLRVRSVTYTVKHWLDDGEGVIEIYLADEN
jgi:hypothetical protein